MALPDKQRSRYTWFFLLVAFASVVHSEDIKLLNGGVLKDATITSYDAIGVTITHSSGISRVPYNELPAELRQKFSYDPKKAQEQVEAETRAARQRAQQERLLLDQQSQEAAAAELSEQLDKAAVRISGKVLSVTPDGLLLIGVSIKVPAKKDVVVWRNPLDGSPRYARVPGFNTIRSDEPIFVYGAHGLVDGDLYAALVYPGPDYSYTAASRAAKTVRAFSASKEICQRLLEQKGASNWQD